MKTRPTASRGMPRSYLLHVFLQIAVSALGCGTPPSASTAQVAPATQASSTNQAATTYVADPATNIVSTTQASSMESDAKIEKFWVYIGTYTSSIHQYEFDLASGKLRPVSVTTGVRNPSFLAIHPNNRFLYAVDEVSSFGKWKTGAVSAFSIDPETGKLTLLNHQPSGGRGPCHLIVDRSGKYVLVANYLSGSVAVLPILEDGSLGEPSSIVQHKGKSVNPKRQTGPHAHSINLDPENRFAFVADLGIDKVLIYRFDADRGVLEENEPSSISVAPGAGPRHFAFHPNGRYAFLLNELHSNVMSFAYDAEKGALQEVQTISALPASYRSGNLTAEVQVHPSGKFLYSSNRGHNSIAIFSIEEETGELTSVGHDKSGGRTPRNFGIDPTGSYLLAANQFSSTLVVFHIDQETGRLSATGESVKVTSPVCVKFVPVSR